MNKNKEEEKTENFGYSTYHLALEEENRILRETLSRLKNELDRMKTPPLMVCEVSETQKEGIILKVANGSKFFVNQNPELKLKSGDTVLTDQKNLNIIKAVSTSKTFDVSKFVIMEKPTLGWSSIGGLEQQIQEIKEVIELPLKKPELFKKIGIKPPKGLLLHGPPGTGKTILAKAVAKSTNSTFIEIVASELVQKYIGEGAKLVKEIFQLAKEKSPSIIFIDELDALASKRIDIGTSGEREVERTFMQLLAEIDGFKPLGNVKIIGCTNRRDILDPAITRPGRLDRLIEVPLPSNKGIEQIFKIHTKGITLDKKINHTSLFHKMEGMSGAEINAIVMEAGYFAIRNNRTKLTESDFEKAIKKVKKVEEENLKDYLHMFG